MRRLIPLVLVLVFVGCGKKDLDRERRWDRLQSRAEEDRDAPESRNLLELRGLHVERAWVKIATDQMNMAPSWRRFLMVASIAIGLALCGSVLLPILTGSSNCGGNSAALAACSSISTSFQVISADRGDKTVAISDLSASERENFGQVPGLSWLGKSRVLVTPAKICRGGREIVAV